MGKTVEATEPSYRARIRQKAIDDRERSDGRTMVTAIEELGKKIDRLSDDTTPQKVRENRWRKFEVFGLWVAAFVGAAAIIAANRDAVREREIMQGQLKATQAQIEITVAQLRPKLDLEFLAGTGLMGKDPVWYFTPQWTNNGSTSAIVTSSWDRSTDFPVGSKSSPPVPRDVPKHGSHAVGPTRGVQAVTRYFSASSIESALAGKTEMVMWGSLTFHDELPNSTPKTIRWCFKAVPTRAAVASRYAFSYMPYRADCNSGG